MATTFSDNPSTLEEDWDFFVDVLVPIAIRHGDWQFLGWYVQDYGGVVTDELRKLLGDILKGKVKRPNNRATSTNAMIKHVSMAQRVAALRAGGCSATEAEGRVMERYGVDRRTVQRAVRKYGAEVADWALPGHVIRTLDDLDDLCITRH